MNVNFVIARPVRMIQLRGTHLLLTDLSVRRFFLSADKVIEYYLEENSDWQVGRSWLLEDVEILLS